MTDLQRAVACLEAENRTCVLCKDGIFYKSDSRGVAPLLQWLDDGIDAADFSAADRVVGKATAFLYSLLGVRAVYARVMSKPAAQVLEKAGIAAHWGQLVEGIQNRQQNGPCPMEAATRHIDHKEAALTAIRQTLERLRANGK